ncbi:replication-relaxation family protein [Nocardia huaxiensis]|uniref:Replication-relaxation family protein n=1 Tax=Nocardia huaxiensis TaxID=2755382 RepID=A0A7D6Z9K8_9NOCA|nr:replication-relaxation family protein [Nocardia huaxiensis]QLY30388.1 replication-relaxation family protein [Nocardia huaxiensis]
MRQVDLLREQLSERDIAIVEDVERFRLLTTRQIQRLHFTTGHQSVAAATRATTRVLQRLRGHGVISTLTRRVGGVRQGSDSLTWQLTATGDRLLRHLHGRAYRRRYREPSPEFTKHTLTVANLGVLLREAEQAGRIELSEIGVEGQARRMFVGRHGAREVLKPDLYAVTAGREFEHHWFIEADRGTEHDPHLARKLGAYSRFFKSGRYQAEHGLFPSVLWVVPDDKRAAVLSALIATIELGSPRLFEICTYDRFIGFVVTATNGGESMPLPGILESTERRLESDPNDSIADVLEM